MRKALIVGIDYYQHVSCLSGCARDANAVNSALCRHGDGSVNFGTKVLTSTSPVNLVTRKDMRENILELFSGDPDIALLYFSGHGYIESTGGFICGSESQTGDDGLSLSEIMTIAVKSNARNKVIVLDSCHSGVAGDSPTTPAMAELADGMTVLTASTAEQYALDGDNGGVFTNLFVDALNGAAANLVGDVTPGSVYAHIDQSLGPWAQRPVFKTNVKTFVSLRKVQPPIPLEDLRRISEFFPYPGYEFNLDPSYEPEGPTPDPEKNKVFAILQKFNRVNLVVPIGAPHMWHAAMNSKSCKLTALGEHYRHLAQTQML